MRRPHGPGPAIRVRHPGGKDGWYRVGCVAEECSYSATEATQERAVRRVEMHAQSKSALPDSRLWPSEGSE